MKCRRSYNEREAETHEGIAGLLVVEDHAMGRQVETAMLVAAVEGRHVSGAGKGHRDIVTKEKNAENKNVIS
jgi:hypothetical protein